MKDIDPIDEKVIVDINTPAGWSFYKDMEGIKYTPEEALDKIDHTVCLAFNEDNEALFNRDKEEHIDCRNFYEFVDCWDVLYNAICHLRELEEEVETLKQENESLWDRLCPED